jgi:opacity protein-like surface antigen
MKKIILCTVLLTALMAQTHAADLTQPYRLISGHTAGVLPKSAISAEIDVYAARGGYGSGLITGIHVGITNRFMLGLSYGGEGLIGFGNRVRWNAYPGVMVKYRLLDEKFVTPALTVGFDNQGYGGPTGTGQFYYTGYIYKSPGFFAAASKNYIMLNTLQIGFHGMANYSLEGDPWPNLLAGIDLGINSELSIIAEYDFALNDITGRDNVKNNRALPHRGFLNVGLRWAFTENFHLQFHAKDIFENKIYSNVSAITIPGSEAEMMTHRPLGWSRELKVIYISKF